MPSGYRKRKPRVMRPNGILPLWFRLQKTDMLIEKASIQESQEFSDDPMKFCEQVIGVKPYSYQADFIRLFVENQFTAARWCRQSSKSFIIAAMLL